jgi:signal transduction histidine kinase
MRTPSDDSTRVATPSPGPAIRHPGFPAEKVVSGASRRLRALAALSGSLTDALDPSDAVELVEKKALAALDATSAVVVTLGAFPPPKPVAAAYSPPLPVTLHVVHAIGIPAEISAALEQLPLDAPVPFAEVARPGEPSFLSSVEELAWYPAWGAAMIAAGARAAAIVPVWANGELRGVLGLAWATPRVFDEDERAFVLTLGVMCAQAIMRAHLKAAELRAREDAVQAREAAEQANLSKARFVATISHELRTPLNAVLGYTQLLADEVDGPVSQRQQEHLGRVRASGSHLLGLIEDLLGYARVEAGEEVVHAEPVVLLEVVLESLALVRPLAEAKGLRLRVEGPEHRIEFRTDRRKLRQILINLLANAVKFTSAGEVHVQLRIDGIEARATIHVEVTDTGRGIALADQGFMFEPFWQKEHAGSHAQGGTGLGLSVARQLARLLGGDVTVTRSAVGQGSTFVLSLPADSRLSPAA